MDARTAEALEASIKHWEGNVAVKSINDVSIAGQECALCRMFRIAPPCAKQTAQQIACVGCPVRAKTGFSSCRGSPYDLVEDEYDLLVGYEEDEELDITALRVAMQKELDFLISLREPDKGAAP